MAYPEYLPRQTLYHYTSIDGLSAIAKSKCLRFSDLASANDPREIHVGREKVFVALRSVLDDEYKAGKSENLLHLIIRLIAYFDGVQIFCSCLSMTGDALPMWNAYGANYGGVSIGFRPRAIMDMTGRIQKVKYLDAVNEGDFRSLALDIAAKLQTIHSPSEPEKWINAGISAICAATPLKHNTWSHEDEVRLIYVQRRERPQGESAGIPISQSADGKPVGWRQPSKRLLGRETVNYFDFPFGRFEKGSYDPARSIECVVIGPKCPLSVKELHELLKAHGFDDFTLRRSICQIR
jgi:hypothetical protein